MSTTKSCLGFAFTTSTVKLQFFLSCYFWRKSLVQTYELRKLFKAVWIVAQKPRLHESGLQYCVLQGVLHLIEGFEKAGSDDFRH